MTIFKNDSQDVEKKPEEHLNHDFYPDIKMI